MEKIFEVEIDPLDRDYLQYLVFEKSSYSDILSYILLEKQKGYEYSIENYNHFMNEYKEANIKYDLFFTKLLDKYAPQYSRSNEYYADFDLVNCQLIISKHNNCSK